MILGGLIYSDRCLFLDRNAGSIGKARNDGFGRRGRHIITARTARIFRRSMNIMPPAARRSCSRATIMAGSFRARLGDLGLAKSELTRHIAWDIGIAGVADALSDQLGAHLIAQRYSRLVIDCNRPPGAPSSIPRISEATTIPGNEGILREAAEARRREIFDPYHRRIDAGHRRPLARPCADGAGGAAQLHAGLCRDRAALAYRRALSSRHAPCRRCY